MVNQAMENNGMATDTQTKKPRFTSVVRRGLADVRTLVVDSFDANKPPSNTVTSHWTKKRQREFNAAMDWIDAHAPKEPQQ